MKEGEKKVLVVILLISALILGVVGIVLESKSLLTIGVVLSLGITLYSGYKHIASGYKVN